MGGERRSCGFSIDTNEFSEAYPKAQWEEFLGSGVMILSENAGLIHYKEPEATMRLLSRGELLSQPSLETGAEVYRRQVSIWPFGTRSACRLSHPF